MHSFLWTGLIAISLTACSPSNDVESADKSDVSLQQIDKTQAYYFLESLKLVEQSGQQLQNVDRTKASIDQALSGIDVGMSLAFEVNAKFLNELDVRLGQNYQRYFIDGVQTYRIGIEAADQDEQKKGLVLLNHWAQFWGRNKAVILQKISA
jgi:hypothetical protein